MRQPALRLSRSTGWPFQVRGHPDHRAVQAARRFCP